jgi:hypothetical protein
MRIVAGRALIRFRIVRSGAGTPCRDTMNQRSLENLHFAVSEKRVSKLS